MADASEDRLESGRLIEDRYRLERLLGEGGMGVVWAAIDENAKESVALKFLRSDRTGDPKNRERFLREANAAMAVDHPNIARVRAVRELANGVPFLVLDLLDGESLRSVLRRRRVLTAAEASRILVPAIDAVEAAHAKGIIHRDLKPENIFVTGANDVRVLDFGIAKRLVRGDEPSPESLTSTGALIGTPSYMAPEQVFDDEDLDARADVWAFGIILYECLAGKRPTEGDGFGQVLRRITTDSLVPLEDAAPGVPRLVASVVTRMLSRNRNDRPALSEVRAVLERAVAVQDAQVTADVPPPTRREDAHVVVAPSLPPPPPKAPLTTTKAVVSQKEPSVTSPPVIEVIEEGRPTPRAPTAKWVFALGTALAIGLGTYALSRGAPSAPSASVTPTPPTVASGSASVASAAPTPSSVATALAPSPSPSPAPPPTPLPSPLPHPTTSAPPNGAEATQATQALLKRDGPSCLKAFDAHDASQPADARSTSGTSAYASSRAMCMMLAGDCTGGRALYKRFLAAHNSGGQTEDVLESSIDALVGDYCEGASLTPRDEVVRANHRLAFAANGQRKASAAECLRWHESIRKLAPTLKPRGSFDSTRDADANLRVHAPACLARANDCANATRIHREEWIRTRPKAADLDPKIYEMNITNDLALQLGRAGGQCKP